MGFGVAAALAVLLALLYRRYAALAAQSKAFAKKLADLRAGLAKQQRLSGGALGGGGGGGGGKGTGEVRASAAAAAAEGGSQGSSSFQMNNPLRRGGGGGGGRAPLPPAGAAPAEAFESFADHAARQAARK